MTIVATGDFNGDGKDDVFWRDTAGHIGMWLMNGTSVRRSLNAGNVLTLWETRSVNVIEHIRVREQD